jgi:hypothetical protein
LVENVGIQKLLLNSTNIGDEVFLSLSLSLSLHVSMVWCNMKFYFQGAKAISDMLKKNKTIRFVQLSNNTIEYSVCINIY